MSSSATLKRHCATCEKNSGVFTCDGCGGTFCAQHVNEHRQILAKQMDEIINEHDELYQTIDEQEKHIDQYPSMTEVDQWERQSIDKIRRIAENIRQELKQRIMNRTQHIQTAVEKLTRTLKAARAEDDFVETDLKLWSNQLDKLKSALFIDIPLIFKNIDEDLICFVSQDNCNLHERCRQDGEVEIKDQLFVRPNHCNTTQYALEKTDSSVFPRRIVQLSKTTERFGFDISGGREQNLPIYIAHIIPDSVAWKHGELKVGDHLLSINDVSVENESLEKVLELTNQNQRTIKLIVR